MDGPCSAIVSGGDHRGISAAAVLVGNIRGAIGANFDVSVQAAAVGQRVNRHGGAISKAAVQADSAGGVNHILGAVIDGVLISNGWRQLRYQAGSERAAADRLMIDSSRSAASHRGRVAGTVIITE